MPKRALALRHHPGAFGRPRRINPDEARAQLARGVEADCIAIRLYSDDGTTPWMGLMLCESGCSGCETFRASMLRPAPPAREHSAHDAETTEENVL